MHASDRKPDAASRLIVALDLPNIDAARHLIEQLGDTVKFYKVGLEMFMSGDGFRLVNLLLESGKQVFVDLKFFDIPQTVGRAVAQLEDSGVSFITVHGNDAMLRAAAEHKGAQLKVLAVTVLTSLDRGDLDDLGFQCNVEDLVLSRTKRALQLGCDGVVASGLEAAALRENLGDDFIIVTPGIRPAASQDDQKRSVNVAQAFANGADYIVVGRPIRDASDPQAAAAEMIRTIEKVKAAEF